MEPKLKYLVDGTANMVYGHPSSPYQSPQQRITTETTWPYSYAHIRTDRYPDGPPPARCYTPVGTKTADACLAGDQYLALLQAPP